MRTKPSLLIKQLPVVLPALFSQSYNIWEFQVLFQPFWRETRQTSPSLISHYFFVRVNLILPRRNEPRLGFKACVQFIHDWNSYLPIRTLESEFMVAYIRQH